MKLKISMPEVVSIFKEIKNYGRNHKKRKEYSAKQAFCWGVGSYYF